MLRRLWFSRSSGGMIILWSYPRGKKGINRSSTLTANEEKKFFCAMLVVFRKSGFGVSKKTCSFHVAQRKMWLMDFLKSNSRKFRCWTNRRITDFPSLKILDSRSSSCWIWKPVQSRGLTKNVAYSRNDLWSLRVRKREKRTVHFVSSKSRGSTYGFSSLTKNPW